MLTSTGDIYITMSFIYKDKHAKPKPWFIILIFTILNLDLANCNDCFQVHLTRVHCNGTLDNSKDPQLTENVVTVSDSLDQASAISELKQENVELRKKFTKTYDSLEETIDYLRNKMLDWSKSQGKVLFSLKTINRFNNFKIKTLHISSDRFYNILFT